MPVRLGHTRPQGTYLARVIAGMHAQWAELGIAPWIEFVKSAANLADDPSRAYFVGLDAMGSIALEGFVFPVVEDWGES